MSWPLFFTINSIECVRRVQGQGRPEAPVSARNVYMWSRLGEENCRFPLLGVNIGLAVVAYRHGCVCVYVCEALLFTNFDKFLFRIISCAQAVHTRTNTHTHPCTPLHCETHGKQPLSASTPHNASIHCWS